MKDRWPLLQVVVALTLPMAGCAGSGVMGQVIAGLERLQLVQRGTLDFDRRSGQLRPLATPLGADFLEFLKSV